MKAVHEWDESDLDQIVQADQKETTTLDYKASAALLFKNRTTLTDGKGTLGDKHRQDMIRDVASMANAEGGLIIYGIAERSGGYPDCIDDGVDPKIVSAEQIEQIILSNINPRVEGVFVHRIDLKSKRSGRCAFVSRSRRPAQTHLIRQTISSITSATMRPSRPWGTMKSET